MRSRLRRLSGELISMSTNGLPLVVGPRLRKRTRSLLAATCCMYSTILSQRTSFLSLPMRKPKYCSGDWIAAEAANAVTIKAKRRGRIFIGVIRKSSEIDFIRGGREGDGDDAWTTASILVNSRSVLC